MSWLGSRSHAAYTKLSEFGHRFLTPKEFYAVLIFLGIGVAGLLYRGGSRLIYSLFPPISSDEFRSEERRQDSIFALLSAKKFNEDSLKFWSPRSQHSSSDEASTGLPKGHNLAPGSIALNTASIADLKQLPGIGDVMAARIVEYRTKQKRFNSLEELKNVSGIGEKKFAKMKEYLTLQ